MSTRQNSDYREVLKRLGSARSVIAFTGAGISAESGIPTFRRNGLDSGGLWGEYRVEEVATPEAFQKNPKLVWDFYLERRARAFGANPNQAHVTIAEWEKQFPFAGVVTQNIDGLHAKAGSVNIQELHGNLWKVRCTKCDFVGLDKDEIAEAGFRGPGEETSPLPTCPNCSHLLRPHIVWFGEPLDFDVIQTSLQWMKKADVIFAVGTSGVVEPAASFVREAKYEGAFLVEINIEPTALSPIADISLFGKSGDIFGERLKL